MIIKIRLIKHTHTINNQIHYITTPLLPPILPTHTIKLFVNHPMIITIHIYTHLHISIHPYILTPPTHTYTHLHPQLL